MAAGDTRSLLELALIDEFPERQGIPPDDSLLCYALRKSCTMQLIISLVCIYECDPCEDDAKAFYLAIVLGRLSVVQWMLRGSYTANTTMLPINPAAHDQRALRTARRCEHDMIILLLLAHPAVDATIDDHELLVYACDRRNALLVRALVTWGPRSNATGKTQFVDPWANDALAIHTVLARGDPACIQLVLFEWKHPEGRVMSPRTAMRAAMLQRIDSSLVRDQLHSMWQTAPRDTTAATPPPPPRTTTQAMYFSGNEDDDDDDDYEDIVLIEG